MNKENMIDWKEIRGEFPVCKRFTYLNPAGGSPMSRRASEEGQRFYKEMLEYGDTYWDAWLERTEAVRNALASFIGAERDEIGFTTNTSHGMNLVVQMILASGISPLSSGKLPGTSHLKPSPSETSTPELQTVLTMRDEFPSTTFPWLNKGAGIRFVEPENYGYSIENIEKAITPDVKVLVSSYVQYKTGFRQDLEALGRLCRKHNLIFVVNATQALGIFPVDVKKCNIDFLMFTGLKWATAGYGIGGLYIDRKWLGQIDFPFAGWRSVREPGKMDNMLLDLKPEASVIEAGCPHFPNIFALGGALQLFNRIGKENVASRVIYLNRYLENKLKEAGFQVIVQEKDMHRSGILIVKMENPKPLVTELAQRKIIVSARGEGMRVSTSIWNNEEDIDLLVSELRKLI